MYVQTALKDWTASSAQKQEFLRSSMQLSCSLKRVLFEAALSDRLGYLFYSHVHVLRMEEFNNVSLRSKPPAGGSL